MAEFVKAKVGDRIKLTGKGLGGTSKENPGDIVVVTAIKEKGTPQEALVWKGGGGIYNKEGRFEIVEEEQVALTEEGPHWYL